MADDPEKRIVETEYRITFGDGDGERSKGERRDGRARDDRDRDGLEGDDFADAAERGGRRGGKSGKPKITAATEGLVTGTNQVAQASLDAQQTRDLEAKAKTADVNDGRSMQGEHADRPRARSARQRARLAATRAALGQPEGVGASDGFFTKARGRLKQEIVSKFREATVNKFASVSGLAIIGAALGQAMGDAMERQDMAAKQLGYLTGATNVEKRKAAALGAVEAGAGVLIEGAAGLLNFVGGFGGTNVQEEAQAARNWLRNALKTDLEIKAEITAVIREEQAKREAEVESARAMARSRVIGSGLPVWAQRALTAEIDRSINAHATESFNAWRRMRNDQLRTDHGYGPPGRAGMVLNALVNIFTGSRDPNDMDWN